MTNMLISHLDRDKIDKSNRCVTSYLLLTNRPVNVQVIMVIINQDYMSKDIDLSNARLKL